MPGSGSICNRISPSKSPNLSLSDPIKASRLLLGESLSKFRGSHSIHNGVGGLGSPWEGLASFLLGDDWCNHQELHPKPRLANDKLATISNANGFANPNGSTAANGKTNSGKWNVPRYDSIGPLPQRSFRKGNRKRTFFHGLVRVLVLLNRCGGSTTDHSDDTEHDDEDEDEEEDTTVIDTVTIIKVFTKHPLPHPPLPNPNTN